MTFVNGNGSKYPSADFVQVDKALESYRDSGFDLCAAAGEPVDNSIEANAKTIRIETFDAQGTHVKKVEAIAFADDGAGIPLNILSHVLSMGFSTRYGQRNGLGRFGVGLKLAGLSQGKRIDIWTRPLGTNTIGHVYIDLEAIKNDDQREISVEEVDEFPEEYAHLMASPKGEPFKSGTLVVWSQVDRLVDGGRFGTAIRERLQELTKFLARAYRKFIDQGLYIEMNGRHLSLHDPLFLLYNPRVVKAVSKDVRGDIVEEGVIAIEGAEVRVTVSLLPPELRSEKGAGGRAEKLGDAWKELYIPDNDGKVSILRQGREIYYDIVPRLFPNGRDEGGIDRFIGVEVNFPAALDEYFQVRNVKRGAEPVDKLRKELREFLDRPIKVARKMIRDLWYDVEKQKRAEEKQHAAAAAAVKKAEETSPRGRANLNMPTAEAEQLVNNLLQDIGIDPATQPEKAQEIKQQVEQQPITIADSNWPGKEMFEIAHLNAKAIITLNHRHPFIREIYDPIKVMADSDVSQIAPQDALNLARKVESAIVILFMAYAKAENMHDDPDRFGDLRSYWGQFTQAYVRELLKQV